MLNNFDNIKGLSSKEVQELYDLLFQYENGELLKDMYPDEYILKLIDKINFQKSHLDLEDNQLINKVLIYLANNIFISEDSIDSGIEIKKRAEEQMKVINNIFSIKYEILKQLYPSEIAKYSFDDLFGFFNQYLDNIKNFDVKIRYTDIILKGVVEINSLNDIDKILLSLESLKNNSKKISKEHSFSADFRKMKKIIFIIYILNALIVLSSYVFNFIDLKFVFIYLFLLLIFFIGFYYGIKLKRKNLH